MLKQDKSKGLPSLDQVLKQIDDSLAGIDDSQALRLGMAALTGTNREAEKNRFILLSISDFHLAVPVEGISEVGDLPAVTRLPNVPYWMQGIINMRNEIISVVDLPKFMGWRNTPQAGEKVVVLAGDGIKAGIRINQILGTVVKSEEFEKVTELPYGGGAHDGLFPEKVSVRDTVYYSLDCSQLLKNERFVNLVE